MTTDIVDNMLLHSTRLNNCQDPWLVNIIRRELAELSLSVPQWDDTGCTLVNIGEFLVRSTTLLSQLANCVVYGQHIDIYTNRKIRESEAENDLSELTFLDRLEDKHRILKSIASKLQETAEEADYSWKECVNDSPASPLQTQRPRLMPQSSSYSMSQATFPAESSGFSSDSPSGELESYEPPYLDDVVDLGKQSPESDHYTQSHTNDTFASLSSRGKGHYVCPRGADCSKGGVGPDGEIVVFERNSAFRSVLLFSCKNSQVALDGVFSQILSKADFSRAHLSKHEKRYKCDIPGCNNKDGFARKDQLRRHKESVSHMR